MLTCKSREIAHRFSTRLGGTKGRKPAAIEVKPFERQTAAQFLLSLLNRPPDVDSANDEELALKIAGSVGNFPLALDLIGCLIRKCGITMQQFVREHPAFERELIGRIGVHGE